MMKPEKLTSVAAALVLLLSSPSVWAGDIRSTKHNLSISGTGDITASSESQICIFCHIPHGKGPTMSYLWNRSTSSEPYIPYDSSTLNAEVGQPTGSSQMCLSCHDGTIALGATATTTAERTFKGGYRYIPEDRASYLGTDLSDDHPVSFVYDAALAQDNLRLKDPAMLPPSIKLSDDQELQCTACHDPHDDMFGRFLVMDNTASALCIACHDETGWDTSSHSCSTAMLDRSGGLWPNTDYQTTAENGCENCHLPHSAGSGQRLLYFANEEENCLVCHDGGVSASDIETDIGRPYRHPVEAYIGVHDAAEDFSSGSVPEHVECSDCHNAHQANEDPASGDTLVSGGNRGVTGISLNGTFLQESQYTYEICFKCHGDDSVVDTFPVTRQIDQLNTRLEFDTNNPSFHPVAASGNNPNVPSLLAPYTTSSVINCTACHGGGDSSLAGGPHGSEWQYLLVDQYVTDDFTFESPASYALCYACHSRTSLLNDDSFPHQLHVEEENAPCSACHDPHGISNSQGDAVHNSHLINFDLDIVSPDGTGQLAFNDLGVFQGEC